MRRYWRSFVDGLFWRRKYAPSSDEIARDIYGTALVIVMVMWLGPIGALWAVLLGTFVPLYAGFRAAWLAERLPPKLADSFRCPHDGCTFAVTERCDPHAECIGDNSEAVGRHCWDVHRCVMEHHDSWTHAAGLSGETTT